MPDEIELCTSENAITITSTIWICPMYKWAAVLNIMLIVMCVLYMLFVDIRYVFWVLCCYCAGRVMRRSVILNVFGVIYSSSLLYSFSDCLTFILFYFFWTYLQFLFICIPCIIIKVILEFFFCWRQRTKNVSILNLYYASFVFEFSVSGGTGLKWF